MVENSPLIKPLAEIIEAAVTDNRGFDVGGRVRSEGIEDNLAVQERLGWMQINRAEVVYSSTLKDWSVHNLTARAVPFEVVPQIHQKPGETYPAQDARMLLVSPNRSSLQKVVYGNVNAHFGPTLVLPNGTYPMIWDADYLQENEPAILASSRLSFPPIELFNGNAHRLTHLSTAAS